MPFYVFKLIFAALVVGLAIILVLIVRQVRSKRPGKAASSVQRGGKGATTRPLRPRLPSRAKTAVGSVPDSPAPTRRRQIRPLSEMEAAESASPLPEEPLGQPAGSDAPIVPELLARLERAFEQLQQDTITLEGYVEQVRAEQAAVKDRLANLGPIDGEEAAAADEAVRWCLEWAEEQQRQRRA